MKSTVIIIVLLLFIHKGLLSQDIIYKKDASEIKSKVVEITETVIKYTNFEQQNGPIRNIPKDQVFMITYQNGTVEKFNSADIQVNNSNAYETQTKTFPPFKSVTWTEKIRNFIYSSQYGLDQRYIKEINCSENGQFFSFYSVNAGQQFYSFNLYDIVNDKYIKIACETKLDDFSATLNSFSSFSPLSNQFYTLLNGNVLQFFDVETGNELYNFKGGKDFRMPNISYPGLTYNEKSRSIETNNSYIYSADGSQVKKLSSESDLFTLLNTGNGDLKMESVKILMQLEFVPKKPLAIAWPSGFSKSIYLYDLSSGKRLLEFADPGKGLLSRKCKISSDGTLLIGSIANNIVIWDISSGKIIKILAAHEKFINDFDVTPNNLLVTCSSVESINLWNISENFTKVGTINPLNYKGKNVAPAFVFFTKDGGRLCCITFQSELIIWDLNFN